MALNPSRLGADNGSTGTAVEFANFLKVFGGEVLAAFKEQNLFMPITTVQTIGLGKSAQFPVLGRAAASYHTPGDSIITGASADSGTPNYSSLIKTVEKEIFIDDALISAVLVPDVDKLLTHYEYRQEYINAIVHALTKKADTNIISTIYAASLATESISGETGRPTVSVDATFDTSASALRQGLFDAKVALDSVDVPFGDRYCALRPTQYSLLAATAGATDTDNISTGQEPGKGQILRVAGFTLVQTNNMHASDSDLVTAQGVNNDPFASAGIGYNADQSDLMALCFHKSCAGTVKVSDVLMESDYVLERKSELMVASYLMGHNVLRPEAAVHLSVA
jgi:hypothetical protein